MKTLILMQNSLMREGFCLLAIRTSDLGDTNYHRLLSIPIKTGHGIAAGDNDVRWLYPQDWAEGVAPISLRITLREDPEPETRLWALHADSPAGSEILGYLDDHQVFDIYQISRGLNFEGGALDWDAHGRVTTQLSIKSMIFKAAELVAEAERLEAKLASASVASPSP